ncbi:hypothetical protein JCGZ_00699 [Jatropha curcas]|uniref:Uncharacterized protein n=2 Tax=Jatropha curcas TaxID=180498 RepID=A0A067KS33_JATCU|nr:hypothetical protein JCGZ_00699 [Jatropha curcas]
MDEVWMYIDDHNIDQPMGGGGISSQADGVNHVENHVEQSTRLVETMGDLLPATKPIGKEFERNKNKIWSWLMDENVSSIGIYGMAGVGKTELAKHINNELATIPSAFDHVYWVTVSVESNICKLQNAISRAMYLDLSSVDDEHIRAARLSEAFTKSILILDDVWKYIPLDKVGIPVIKEGCKLVLTTRSLDVCQKMSCQEKIKVTPLSEEESWKFFKKEAGCGVILSLEFEAIAKSIVENCGGLPLAIDCMATQMRGMGDIHEWMDASNKLEGVIARQENVEIFEKLRLSYDYLNDSALQKCFLYCALYPKGDEIEREELIDNLIAEGIIEQMESRQAELNRGHSMLNRLVRLCLLEGSTSYGYGHVKMHDLIRDMAIQIMKMNPRAIVQAGKQLIEMPNEEELVDDLVRCSLMHNCIEGIPYGYSPKCPNLSTLLLCGNEGLRSISSSFFEQLDGLKVLDLSHTDIEELPSSISYLVNLSALLLRWCQKLRCLPSLAKLRALKKLDLRYCGVDEVPQGIELLSKLRYLNIEGTNMKDLFPPGLLPNLSNLQFLNLGFEFSLGENVDDVAELVKLEALICRFNDVDEFNANASIFFTNLIQFGLLVGDKESHYRCLDELLDLKRKFVCFNECDINGVLVLPKKVEELIIDGCCIETNGLCLQNATELKYLEIKDCNGIACLFSLSSSSPCIFQTLENITIHSLEDLQFLFSREATIPLSPPLPTFSLLKVFHLYDCPRMKHLFPSGCLSNLHNLQQISVCNCENMEELIAVGEEQESHDNIQFILTKLQSLNVSFLPQLKRFCREKIICDSLQEISVVYCGSVKQLFLPGLLSNLKNLERIFVSCCANMEELIAMEEQEQEQESHDNIQFTLPKLESLNLSRLPLLKSICRGRMICSSLQQIRVSDCPKLKQMPLCLILTDNGSQPFHLPTLQRINAWPREWWESVELDHPNAKSVLLPLCDFFLYA